MGGHPLRVAVISDVNGAYGDTVYAPEVHAAVARIIALRPDLVLSTGDMIGGERQGLDDQAMWAAFDAAVTNPLAAAGIPFAVTPGNHDASAYPAYARERSIFAAHFRAHRPAVHFVDDAHYPLRYAFTMGPALFVSLDDTTVGQLAPEQRAWLDHVLAKNAAEPVRIVYGHVPLYAFTVGREHEILGDGALERILLARGVDLFLTGHDQGYFPARHGRLRLVGMPCLGSGRRRLIGTSEKSPKSFVTFTVTRRGIRSLDAFGGPHFARRMARASLPRRIGQGPTALVRDDLR